MTEGPPCEEFVPPIPPGGGSSSGAGGHRDELCGFSSETGGTMSSERDRDTKPAGGGDLKE